jgi:hypothetical protein
VSRIQLSNTSKARSKVGSESPAVRVLVKPLTAANDNLIDQTRKVWQPRLGLELRDDDATQIIENVVGFFSILAEWSTSEMPAPANYTGKPHASGDEGARHAR